MFNLQELLVPKLFVPCSVQIIEEANIVLLKHQFPMKIDNVITFEIYSIFPRRESDTKLDK